MAQQFNTKFTYIIEEIPLLFLKHLYFFNFLMNQNSY